MEPITPIDKPTRPIPNHLIWAILTTLLCCLPFGIVSIVYASRVDSKVAMGDYAGAEADSKNAKTWAIVSACVGGVFGLIYFILILAGTVAGM